MATIKRRFANALGRMVGATIVPDGETAWLLERQYLARFLAEFRVDCVFDVGANEGQYADRVRAAGYRGTIVSFEPIPALAAALRARARHEQHWFIEDVPLDETERPVSFNVMRGSQFSSLHAPVDAETARFEGQSDVVETLSLHTARLADLFAAYRDRLGFERPFLKMDTQGNDLAVARGAGERLNDFVGLQSELAVKRLYEVSDDYRSALDFYQAAGFELSAFVPNNFGHFPELLEIDCIMYNRRFHEPEHP